MSRLVRTISVIVLIAILYLGSYGVIVNNFLHAPSYRYYYGAEEGAFDILGNLSAVQQATEGKFIHRHNSSSTIPNEPSLLKQEYMIIGHISRILSLSPLAVYFAAKILLSLILFGVCWYLIRKLIPGSSIHQIFLFFICIFNTGIILLQDKDPIMFRMFYDTLVFQRMTLAKPHYLISSIATVLSLWFLSQAVDKPHNIRAYLLALIFGFIAGYVYIPGAFLIVISIPLFWILYVLAHRKRRSISLLQFNVMLISSIAVISVSIVIIQYAVTSQSPYVVNSTLENAFTVQLRPIEYIYSIGVVYIIALIGLPLFLTYPNTFLLLITPWLVTHPLTVLIGSDILKINKLRFYLTPYYFFFGLLAGFTILFFARWLKKRFRIPANVVYLIFCGIIVASSYPGFVHSITQTKSCFCKHQFYDWAYPYRDIMEGIWWLRDNTENTDIVLSDNYVGNLIIAFSGNGVYTSEWFMLIGHPSFVERFAEMQAFYSGNLYDSEAYEFLKKWNISYVFYSEQEKQHNAGNYESLPYSFLKQVMNNGKTTVYKVE